MTTDVPASSKTMVWVQSHPTWTVIIAAFVLFMVAKILFPPSKVGEPGWIFELFAFGAYTAVSVIRGFFSVFGKQFAKLPPAEKLRSVLLAAILVVPSLGIVLFFVVAFGEFIGQMQCIGGGCAQGGIASALLLVVAWVCYFAVVGLSNLMSKLNWWPRGVTPRFGKNASQTLP
jgi:hypothetical protein